MGKFMEKRVEGGYLWLEELGLGGWGAERKREKEREEKCG